MKVHLSISSLFFSKLVNRYLWLLSGCGALACLLDYPFVCLACLHEKYKTDRATFYLLASISSNLLD